MNAFDATVTVGSAATRDFAGDERLIEVVRGDFVESVHRGAIAVVDGSGAVIAEIGDVQHHVFLRSGAKPFQVMPALLAGGVERFGITERELAVMCSSHNGEPRHVAAVQSVLTKLGLDEQALHCGIHPPLSVEAAADRWRNGLEPTPACNNCSGAHAGMLLACSAAEWPIHDYGEASHPVQRRIREVVAAFAGITESELGQATDRCAVPTFRLPLARAAVMFARLGSGHGVSNSLAGAARSVSRAMMTYPEMVGGEHRLDSDLMAAAAGELVAKGGAEGFQGLGAVNAGLGVALKISDGGALAATTATMRAVEDLKLLAHDALRSLDEYRAPRVLSLRGEVVGRIIPTFHLNGIR